jgi:hypothetical protein
MKKLIVMLCSVLPGGFVLLATMMLFGACARLQYWDPAGNVRVRGFTLNPEAAMVASGETEMIRSQAYAMRKCAEEPDKCRAAELSQMSRWGFGGMDTPAGYTWAGIQAAGGGSSASAGGDIRKEISDIKKTVSAIDKGQDAFFQALKNRKKGN